MQVVKLTSFAPFKNAAHALDEVNAISEAVLTDDLKNFLEVNLPKVSAPSLAFNHPTGPFCTTASLTTCLTQQSLLLACACPFARPCTVCASHGDLLRSA